MQNLSGGRGDRPSSAPAAAGPKRSRSASLARGGSGDVLAGLIGGLLAQHPDDPLLAAARGVVWHGLAADALARAHGQTAVQTTQVLDFLGGALRESAHEQ